jgi:uncharacterized Zn-finger protein
MFSLRRLLRFKSPSFKLSTLHTGPNLNLFNKFQFPKRFDSTNNEPSSKVTTAVVDGVTAVDKGSYILRSNSPGASGLLPGREPIDLIAAVAPIEVKGRIAVCDGGGLGGHPRVFINLDRGLNTCGYCGLRYVPVKGSDHHHH